MTNIAFAQSELARMPQGSPECEELVKTLELPEHYCECKENSHEFHFPMEMDIQDTMWFDATVDELRQGMSAYWFSDCSVTLEVYPFCTSKIPIFSITAGPNQMRDIDAAFINQKLEEMGEMAQALLQQLVPKIRVLPLGGTGRVYCYPYDQGPESKCDDPLPLRPWMTYVCDKEENVYKMEYSLLPSQKRSFIRWKQQKNLPAEIWLTLDSCNGEEVGRAIVTDSLHVYQPDSAMMQKTRQEQRSLWLHVKHEPDMVGRIFWYNNPKYAEPLEGVSEKTCLGKTYTYNLRTYASDTTFVDTLWYNRDTLQTMEMHFEFTQPQTKYDTIYVEANELRRGYLYAPANAIVFTYGDTIIEIVKPETCTKRFQLTIKDMSGYDSVEAGDPRAYKQIQNGQLFIIIDDRRYNVLGQQTKNHIN